MKTQPIKRSDELKVLSREHHFGLLFAWKVREGLKLNVETSRLNAYVNHFWEDHLKNHFLNEEVLLFNMINDPLCIQAKNDHIAIITQIEKINSFGKDDPNAYTKLAEILSNHIYVLRKELHSLI